MFTRTARSGRTPLVRRALVLAVLAAVLATALAGCGGSGDGDTTDGDTTGASTTTSATGSGDAAAGSSGSVGPNLDDASPSYDHVVTQVTEGGGAMPSFKDELTEQQIQDVAAFVSGS